MLVREIMTEDVSSLHPDRNVLIADDIMNWAEVRHVPVVDSDGRVVGIVSRTDLLRASLPDSGHPEERYDAKQHLANVQVRDIMSDPVCIDPEASVHAAARLMRTGKRNCLPVVDSHHTMLGIVTSHDILAIVESLPPAALRRDAKPVLRP